MTLTPRFPALLHGGDYNPDQWLDRPDILEKDVELMHKAHVNCVSLAIFAWARLEPEEGVYDFSWLDEVIDRLWKAGIHVILATPSGARPAWLAQKYPEVLRVNDRLQRNRFGGRHNHCPSSPVYLRKVREIDTALARRYAGHPAVIAWHISNEFSGSCYCLLCQERFRTFLKKRYGTLEEMNRRQWASFWSMAYQSWEQVEPPMPSGQMSNLTLRIDWQRFSTQQCKDFILMEREAVKAVCPELPVTANLMERFWDYDYFSLAEALDFVSWDSYPRWHSGDDVKTASDTAMWHDVMRSLKDQPFLLMESTPSLVNWVPVNKPKKPGMHLLSSLQAVAHGSDSVLYFQWRKGRGGAEQYHGAVVDHNGRDDTRTFRQVTDVGLALEKLESLCGASQKTEVCILYDWENRWALDFLQAARREHMHYTETVAGHYRALWQQGIGVDFRDMREETDLSGYRLVVAPLLYMQRGGIDRKLRDFVAGGGTLVATYFSGLADEDNLAFLSDTPHGLTEVLGVRTEEIDALYDSEENRLVTRDGQSFSLTELCEIISPVSGDVEVLATYGSDWYQGLPCLTRHLYGEGQAFCLAAQAEQAGLDWLYGRLAADLGLHAAWCAPLPAGVVATERGGCAFLQNYTDKPQPVSLPGRFESLLTGETLTGTLTLQPYGIAVLRAAETAI